MPVFHLLPRLNPYINIWALLYESIFYISIGMFLFFLSNNYNPKDSFIFS